MNKKVLLGVSVAAAVLGGLLVSSPTAGARVIEREHYSGTFSHPEFLCSQVFQNEGTFHGNFMLKMRGEQPTPYLFDNYYVREVQTNADGDGFVVVINGMYKDLAITHVRGTIYRFVGIDVGQVYTVRTLDGKAVQRNRGLLKFTFLVDTKGDSNLNNDQFIPNSFRMLKDAGKHPDASATDEEFCAVIEEAIRG